MNYMNYMILNHKTLSFGAYVTVIYRDMSNKIVHIMT